MVVMQVVLVSKDGSREISEAEVGALGLPRVQFQAKYVGRPDGSQDGPPQACDTEVQQVRFELNGVTADPTPGVMRNLPAYKEVVS